MKLDFINKSQRKFVLSIGDEGAILSCVEGSKMISRVFFDSPKAPDLLKHFSASPDAPIHVLVDVVDQAYVQHSLPPVSRLNVNKLVNKKLSKDFDEDDIKAAISMGKEKVGRKDWLYMFLSVRNTAPFSDWMNAISELPNPFGGVFLVPLEAQKFLHDIKKVTENSGNTEWQIVVVHHRVGGFRQIVFKDGNIVFTRIVQPIGGKTPDVVAGNIEQETLNTIEYIRRLGFNEENNLDIYVVASNEVKNVLDSNAFAANSTTIYTPGELAKKLGIESAAEEKDQYGDVVFATHFATRKKHVLRLDTPYTKVVNYFQQGVLGGRVAAALISVLMLVYSAISFSNSAELSEQIEASEIKRANEERELEKIKDIISQFDVNPERVKDISNLDKRFTKNKNLPTKFLTNYSSVKGFNVRVNNIRIKMEPQEDESDIINADFDIIFSGSDDGQLDQLLDEIDLFADDVKRKFKDYEVSFSGRPSESDIKLDLLTDNVRENEQDIKLNIRGPESKSPEDKNKRKRAKRRR